MNSSKNKYLRLILPSRVIVIFSAGFFATAADVQAATIFGDTTGQPTWTRTLSGSPPIGLSEVGTDVPFETSLITVSVDGSYDFLLTSQEFVTDDYDPFLVLYKDTFDPGNQFVNILLANDDLTGSSAGFESVFLTQGTLYIAVATGFENDDFGFYQLEVTGPGEVNFIPEPSAALLCLSSSFGLLLRRARAASISR